MTFSVSVTAKCGKCGAVLLFPDDASSETRIVCADCGEDAGSYSELEARAADAVRERIDGIISGSKDVG